MAKKKVCVSFDYENDKHYKNLLKAWDANKKFDFGFDDKTPDEINSNDYSRVKAVITQRIKSASYVLILVGEYANTKHKRKKEIGEDNWIIWEIEKAKEHGKKIIAIKLKKSYTSPDALKNSGVSWAMSFSEASVMKAFDEA